MTEESRLNEILKTKVSEERVTRLMNLTRPDIQDASEEVLRWLVRQQAQFVNIQYERFQAGIKFGEQDTDDVMHGAIDIHAQC